MSTQAERRAALRRRQAERQARVDQLIRLDRIRQLAGRGALVLLEGLAIEALKAEPEGLRADQLPPKLLEHLVERNLVAVCRGRVVERGHVCDAERP